MNNNNNAITQNVRSVKEKVKSSARQKLEARRAIEQHFEKKRLEHDIQDYWID